MAQFWYAISNRENYVALAKKLQSIGVNFESSGLKNVVGYKIPGVKPNVLADVLAHVNPERKIKAYPFFLDHPVASRSDDPELQKKTTQLANATAVTLKKIKDAGASRPKDKNAMDLMTTTPHNDEIVYAYLNKYKIKYKRYVGMAGIIIEYDEDDVGGIDSTYFVKSALMDAAGRKAETGDDDNDDDSTDVAAILVAFTVLYEHNVDLAKEYFPPPSMSVPGMGTKHLDKATIDKMSRRSVLGTVFGVGGKTLRPFGS